MEHSKKYLLVLLLIGVVVSPLKAQQQVTKNLGYFMEEAVKRSPLLKDYHNQQEANRIDSMRVKAGYLPQVTASSAGMYAPVARGYGYDKIITNGQALEALLNINYNLASKQNINNQLQGIHLKADSLRFIAGLSVLDLQKAVADQYITAFESQQQAAFNLDVYELLKKEEEVLKKLARSNVYKQVDYLTFLVTFQQQQLQWKQAGLQWKNDYATLNYLTGIVDTAVHELAEPGLKAGLAAVQNNFFTRRFEIDSAKIENERRAIDFSYRPKAGVYANGGYNSALTYQPYKNFGASVGFTVSVPIYDGHQRKMQYEQLRIAQRTSNQYRDFFLDTLAQTQRLVLRVNAAHPIPENLIGKVRMIKSAVSNVQLLPKSAVLTNETEDEFWVMKMINDSTAVKTTVKKGLEDGKSIQILSPVFKAKDRLITTGNYGLADTAKVKIAK